MDSDSIRRAFVTYFTDRGHTELPGISLVPTDPSVTTLFTIAGMQQMIGYFTGREEPPNRRLVTVQRSVRTVDIEEVGDYEHLTCLEMLGNFSVGDYWKKEAIRYTWDFLVNVLGIPADRWWAVTYPGDDEARQAWLEVGVPPERIRESEENWWDQGPIGPAGSDSEIHYDRGVEYGCGRPDCGPESGCCDRFLETWNDVFMEFYQEESGERRNLPWKNVDTGMGFERLCMIVQGGESVYDTDLFQPIIASVAALTGRAYGQDASTDRSFRIISDHCRSIAFIIADGVMPSAVGRGYVLRRLLRRASMHGRLLGLDRAFLTIPVSVVVDRMQGYYTYLGERQEHILRVVQQEEARFLQTLTRGLNIFEELATRAAADGQTISGRDAFQLYDTHGFPLELTIELAEERGLGVDREGFERELERQQERGRKDRAYSHTVGTSPETYLEIADRVPATLFTGYDELRTTTEVVAIVADGQVVSQVQAGDEVELILAATPFYAEAGGQVGDTGSVRGDSGWAQVLDTQRPHGPLIAHRAQIVEGPMSVGDVVEAEVDAERRLHILPHHSGTHLLHKALQEVLGPEAVQAGSLVAPDRLRFDFRWPRPLAPDELREVQDRVNAAIWANLPVTKEIKPYEEAMREGAMALFGEKYGDLVRVVSMGEWSKELCGGTHVDATGDIGLLVIVGETGIGSGIRRIEALAGAAAYAYVNDLRDQLGAVAEALGTRPENALGRSRQVMAELREREKREEALMQRLASRDAETLIRQGISINGFTVVANRIAADSSDYLRVATEAVRSRLDRGIVVLGSVVDGKSAFTMGVTRNLSDEGFNARQILGEAARRAEAHAGGRADFAQGGGRDPARVEEVIQVAVELIRQKAEG